MQNPKFEARRPKVERSPKLEIRTGEPVEPLRLTPVFWLLRCDKQPENVTSKQAKQVRRKSGDSRNQRRKVNQLTGVSRALVLPASSVLREIFALTRAPGFQKFVKKLLMELC